MKRPVLIALAGLALVVLVAALIVYNNRPTSLTGDPWDYNLSATDLPEGWRISDSTIETAYDIALEKGEPPQGLLSVHSVAFSHETAVDVFEITSQVILYDRPDSARAALASELPNGEWEQVTASRTVGDETTVWRAKPLEDAPQQAIYRINFRYLNGVASVTVTGTIDGMQGESTVLSYADKVLSKMRKAAQPEAIRVLTNANRPDLRGLLLTQADLARLDPNLGQRWLYNSQLPLGWTPNSAFPNPDGMAQLGRVMGYQVWLIKPLAEAELKPESSTGLFQQVTAFESPEQAEVTLGKMVGLTSGAWEVAPTVGDSAKGWTQVYQSEGTSAGSGVVAATEISFRVGYYVGSIRIQTSPVTQNEAVLAKSANELLADQLALALAGKLNKVGK